MLFSVTFAPLSRSSLSPCLGVVGSVVVARRGRQWTGAWHSARLRMAPGVQRRGRDVAASGLGVVPGRGARRVGAKTLHSTPGRASSWRRPRSSRGPATPTGLARPAGRRLIGLRASSVVNAARERRSRSCRQQSRRRRTTSWRPLLLPARPAGRSPRSRSLTRGRLLALGRSSPRAGAAVASQRAATRTQRVSTTCWQRSPPCARFRRARSPAPVRVPRPP